MRRKKVNVFLTDMFTRTDEKNRTSTRVRRFINTLTEGYDRTDSVPVSWWGAAPDQSEPDRHHQVLRLPPAPGSCPGSAPSGPAASQQLSCHGRQQLWRITAVAADRPQAWGTADGWQLGSWRRGGVKYNRAIPWNFLFHVLISSVKQSIFFDRQMCPT